MRRRLAALAGIAFGAGYLARSELARWRKRHQLRRALAGLDDIPGDWPGLGEGEDVEADR